MPIGQNGDDEEDVDITNNSSEEFSISLTPSVDIGSTLHEDARQAALARALRKFQHKPSQDQTGLVEPESDFIRFAKKSGFLQEAPLRLTPDFEVSLDEDSKSKLERQAQLLWQRWQHVVDESSKETSWVRVDLTRFISVGKRLHNHNNNNNNNSIDILYRPKVDKGYQQTLAELVVFQARLWIATAAEEQQQVLDTMTQRSVEQLEEDLSIFFFQPTAEASRNVWLFLLTHLWHQIPVVPRKNNHPLAALRPESLSHPIAHLFHINRLFCLCRLWSLHLRGFSTSELTYHRKLLGNLRYGYHPQIEDHNSPGLLLSYYLGTLLPMCSVKSFQIVASVGGSSIEVHYNSSLRFDIKADLGCWLRRVCEEAENTLDQLTGSQWRRYDFLNDRQLLMEIVPAAGPSYFEFFGGQAGQVLLDLLGVFDMFSDESKLKQWRKDLGHFMKALCVITTLGKSSHLRAKDAVSLSGRDEDSAKRTLHLLRVASSSHQASEFVLACKYIPNKTSNNSSKFGVVVFFDRVARIVLASIGLLNPLIHYLNELGEKLDLPTMNLLWSRGRKKTDIQPMTVPAFRSAVSASFKTVKDDDRVSFQTLRHIMKTALLEEAGRSLLLQQYQALDTASGFGHSAGMEKKAYDHSNGDLYQALFIRTLWERAMGWSTEVEQGELPEEASIPPSPPALWEHPPTGTPQKELLPNLLIPPTSYKIPAPIFMSNESDDGASSLPEQANDVDIDHLRPNPSPERSRETLASEFQVFCGRWNLTPSQLQTQCVIDLLLQETNSVFRLACSTGKTMIPIYELLFSRSQRKRPGCLIFISAFNTALKTQMRSLQSLQTRLLEHEWVTDKSQIFLNNLRRMRSQSWECVPDLIYFVTPELATTTNFMDFLIGLRSFDPALPTRLVVDEVDQPRAALSNLWPISRSTPFCLLSASLRMTEVDEVVAQFASHPATDSHFNQLPLCQRITDTHLANLGITVRIFEDADAEEQACLELRRFLHRRQSTALVFVPTKALIEQICALAQPFGEVRGLHAAMPEQEKQSTLDWWLSTLNTRSILVSTTYLAFGATKLPCHSVAVYQGLYNVKTFYQAQCRGGRDGGVTEVLLLFTPVINRETWARRNSPEFMRGYDELEQLLRSPGCRVTALSRYFGSVDGQFCSCSKHSPHCATVERPTALCDNCQLLSTNTQQSSIPHQQRQIQQLHQPPNSVLAPDYPFDSLQHQSLPLQQLQQQQQQRGPRNQPQRPAPLPVSSSSLLPPHQSTLQQQLPGPPQQPKQHQQQQKQHLVEEPFSFSSFESDLEFISKKVPCIQCYFEGKRLHTKTVDHGCFRCRGSDHLASRCQERQWKAPIRALQPRICWVCWCSHPGILGCRSKTVEVVVPMFFRELSWRGRQGSLSTEFSTWLGKFAESIQTKLKSENYLEFLFQCDLVGNTRVGYNAHYFFSHWVRFHRELQ